MILFFSNSAVRHWIIALTGRSRWYPFVWRHAGRWHWKISVGEKWESSFVNLAPLVTFQFWAPLEKLRNVMLGVEGMMLLSQHNMLHSLDCFICDIFFSLWTRAFFKTQLQVSCHCWKFNKKCDRYYKDIKLCLQCRLLQHGQWFKWTSRHCRKCSDDKLVSLFGCPP